MVTGELPFAVGNECELMQWQAAIQHITRAVHQVVKRVAFNVELPVRPDLHE